MRLNTHVPAVALPRWLGCKESIYQAGDADLIPESGKSSGVGSGNHSSIPDWSTGVLHGQRHLVGYRIEKSQTQLSDPRAAVAAPAVSCHSALRGV